MELSPAEILMSRRLRSTLDLLLPDVKSKIRKKQLKQKEQHYTHSKWRSFSPGDEVYTRNYSHGSRWVPAVIEENTGPVSFTAQRGDGRVMRRHVDQIKKRPTIVTDEMPMPERTEESTSFQGSDTVLETLPANSAVTPSVRERMAASETAQASPSVIEQTGTCVDPLPVLRRSELTRQTPGYLKNL